MSGPLSDSTAVVTGASRGIGRAIALRLAELGADVALWARDQAQLRIVAADITAKHGKARSIVVDVTDPDAVEQAAQLVRATMPRVRTVVNNAGAVLRKQTDETTNEEWREIMAVNLDGTFHVTRAFIRDLTATAGRIINVASRSGREGTAMLAAYCAAKHGVVGLTRALAEELRPDKVTVNAVCPGSVDTPMLRQALPNARPEMTPDDIARTVAWIAHAAPQALTGSCIDVFG